MSFTVPRSWIHWSIFWPWADKLLHSFCTSTLLQLSLDIFFPWMLPPYSVVLLCFGLNGCSLSAYTIHWPDVCSVVRYYSAATPRIPSTVPTIFLEHGVERSWTATKDAEFISGCVNGGSGADIFMALWVFRLVKWKLNDSLCYLVKKKIVFLHSSCISLNTLGHLQLGESKCLPPA